MPDFLADALTWPHNYTYALALETAMTWRVRPLSMIVENAQPNDAWSNLDRKLALSWTIMQHETCQQCGQPLWICRSDNINLGFSVRTSVCYAKMQVEKWQETAKGKNIGKGEYPYVVPRMLNDEELPSRADYIKQLNED